MTATQAPTPGPLSASDIAHVRDYWSAICDSDWHLIPANIRDDLEERLAAVGLAEWRAVTDDDLEDTFAYERGIEKGRSCLDLTALGHLAFKSDADGWMPWSGGENPVPGQRVDAEGSRFTGKLRDTPSDQVRWDRVARFRLAPTAPVEASGSEREELDSAASAFIATSFGFSGPNNQDTPLQAAAREVGWLLSEVVDRIDWNKRGQAANALGRLATSIDGLVWPWGGDDPRHDQIRDAWRSYADNSADEDGRIDLTEVETCVAIGCMKAMQLLSPDLPPQPSGETREAVARLEADADYFDHPEEGAETHRRALCWVAKDIRTVLSARPLALGGQKGEATWHPLDDEGLAEVRVNDKRITSMPSYDGAKEVAQRINAALSTTPARSEALDDDATRLKLAICGGEDVPGAINAVSVEDCERFLAEERQRHSWCAERQTEIDAFQSDKIDVLRVLLGDPVSVSPGSAAHDALKWAIDRIAKAEALDEGAAGEPWGWVIGNRRDGKKWFSQDHTAVDVWVADPDFFEVTPVYRAHPSPTPAADADRVRIAVEALEKINAPLTGPTHGAWDRGRIAGLKEALAALKSEGK